MSKGSNRRPAQISESEMGENWERTFGRAFEHVYEAFRAEMDPCGATHKTDDGVVRCERARDHDGAHWGTLLGSVIEWPIGGTPRGTP